MSASSSRSSSPEPLPKVYFDPNLGKELFEEGKSEIAGVMEDLVRTTTAPEAAWAANNAAKAGVATKIAEILSAGPKTARPVRDAATTSAKAAVDLTRSEALSSKSADLPDSIQKNGASEVTVPKVPAPTPKRAATTPAQTQALSSKSASLPDSTQKNATPKIAIPKGPAHTPKKAATTPAQPETPRTSKESGTNELSARVAKLTTASDCAAEPKEAKPSNPIRPSLDDDSSIDKPTAGPNEPNKESSDKLPERQLLTPVSRRSATTTTISKDLTAQGFFTPQIIHHPRPSQPKPRQQEPLLQ